MAQEAIDRGVSDRPHTVEDSVARVVRLVPSTGAAVPTPPAAAGPCRPDSSSPPNPRRLRRIRCRRLCKTSTAHRTCSRSKRSTHPQIGDDETCPPPRPCGQPSISVTGMLMTGLPYLMRLIRLRGARAEVGGAGVGSGGSGGGGRHDVTQFRPGDEVFGTCDGAFAEYASVPGGSSRPSRPPSPSSKRPPSPPPPAPPSRRCATQAGSGRGRRY